MSPSGMYNLRRMFQHIAQKNVHIHAALYFNDFQWI